MGALGSIHTAKGRCSGNVPQVEKTGFEYLGLGTFRNAVGFKKCFYNSYSLRFVRPLYSTHVVTM